MADTTVVTLSDTSTVGRPPLPKLATAWTVGPTASTRYKALLEHYASIREPQYRSQIENEESQSRRQMLFVLSRIRVVDNCAEAEVTGDGDRVRPASAAPTQVGTLRRRPLSATELRRARAIERHNAKADMSVYGAIPPLVPVEEVPPQPLTPREEEQLHVSSTFKGARLSRPATAASASGADAAPFPHAAIERSCASRPQSGSYLLRRPVSAARELDEGPRARRLRHETAVIAAYVDNESRGLARQYRQLLEEGLRARFAALFGHSASDDPQTAFGGAYDFTNTREHVAACGTVDYLEHALICIRAAELKARLRKLGRLPDECASGVTDEFLAYEAADPDGNPPQSHMYMRSLVRRVRPTTPPRHIIRPSSALGADAWKAVKTLSIHDGPKAAKITVLASSRCSHSGDVVRHLSLMQLASLERFVKVIARIQAAWHGYCQRKRYARAAAAVRLLQRVGGGYLERSRHLGPCKVAVLRKQEEAMLSSWM